MNTFKKRILTVLLLGAMLIIALSLTVLPVTAANSTTTYDITGKTIAEIEERINYHLAYIHGQDDGTGALTVVGTFTNNSGYSASITVTQLHEGITLKWGATLTECGITINGPDHTGTGSTGGTFEMIAGGSVYGRVTSIRNNVDDVLVKVTAGSLTGVSNRAIVSYGNVTINGGTVSSICDHNYTPLPPTDSAVVVLTSTAKFNRTENNKTTLTLNDGTVTTEASELAAIWLQANTVMKMSGGYVENTGNEDYAGEAIEIGESSALTMYDGEIKNGIQVRTLGDCTIRGGKVSSNNLSAINSAGNDTRINVYGSGEVINNTDYAIFVDAGVAPETYAGCRINIANNAVIESKTKNGVGAITGAFHKLTMTGGTIKSTGKAIYGTTGENNVEITGGEIISTYAKDSTIMAGVVSIIDGSITSASTDTLGAVFAEGKLTMSGGTVTSVGPALGTSAFDITVSGGVVFSSNSETALTINTAGYGEIKFPTYGTGVVIACKAPSRTHAADSSTYLTVAPSTATAVWATSEDLHGISYANGANTGFLPIDNVTVIEAVQTIDITDMEPSAITAMAAAGLSTFPDVTVTGELTAVTETILLEVPSTKTLNWYATVTADSTLEGSLVKVKGNNYGWGSFNMVEGLIKNEYGNGLEYDPVVTVIIGGGVISVTDGKAVYGSASTYNTISLGTLTVQNATIEATADGGIAIEVVENANVFLRAGSNIKVVSGTAVKTQGYVEVLNTAVFSKAASPGTVVRSSTSSGSPNTGIVLAWTGEDGAIYEINSKTDLLFSPVNGNSNAYWTTQDGKHGIYYNNGSFTGFIEVEGLANLTAPDVIDITGMTAQEIRADFVKKRSTYETITLIGENHNIDATIEFPFQSVCKTVIIDADISAAADYQGNLLYTYNPSMDNKIIVNGTLRTNTGLILNDGSRGTTLEVNGLLYGHATNFSNMIRNLSSNSFSDTGAVVMFSKPVADGYDSTATYEYNIGDTTDIVVLAADTVTAVWANKQGISGISYTKNETTGFIPVPGTRVIRPEAEFVSLIANGESTTADTTALTLTFDKDIPGLTADDITLTGANIGTLTKESETGVYTLTITGITENGAAVTVTVEKEPYDFTPASREVTVHKALDAEISPATALYTQGLSGGINFTLTPYGYTLTAITGNSIGLTAGTDYTVSTNNPNVYTINTSYLDSIGEDRVIIAFIMSGGENPTAAITIEEAPVQFVPVTGITGVPYMAEINEALTISAAVSPVTATNQTITWILSAGETGATFIDNQFLATTPGTATLTATIENGLGDGIDYTEVFTITVLEPEAPPPLPPVEVETITISGDNEAEVGETITLSAEILPVEAVNKNLTWTSSDTSIAVVDSTGTVTGRNAGTVTITAASVNGITGTIEITIKPQYVAPPFFWGDANGDGDISNMDVTLLKQSLAGWPVTIYEGADANGDGELSNMDVTLLKQFLAGWPVKLGPVPATA
ncbi:MAG: Ig-like domain-containing protein [Ruminococcus sp.]|jgi:hypothetical protein|nr:Ig-like domain-containing protein [Ruminococcus sp.]